MSTPDKEDYIERVILEIDAIRAAREEMHYLRFSPANGDTWKNHCRSFGSKIYHALERAEYWKNNPDPKFG